MDHSIIVEVILEVVRRLAQDYDSSFGPLSSYDLYRRTQSQRSEEIAQNGDVKLKRTPH